MQTFLFDLLAFVDELLGCDTVSTILTLRDRGTVLMDAGYGVIGPHWVVRCEC